jgi:hypothetical protein
MMFRLLIAITAAWALSACAIVRSGDRALYPPAPDQEAVQVYVMYTWMHAELGIRQEEIRRRGGPAADALAMLPPQEWTLIGWGDARFYQERGWTPGRIADLFRSMAPIGDPAVIEIDPQAQAPSPESTGNAVLSLQLSEAGVDRLVTLLNSFFATRNGGPLAVGRGRAPGSQFFWAEGSSHFANNSNHWVGHLLNAAGVPTAPPLHAFAQGLSLDLRWGAGAERVPGDTDAYVGGPETPPTHSGPYRPGDDAFGGHGIAFNGYAVRVGREATITTHPLPLARGATAYNTAGDTFADLMNVPENSFVDVRSVQHVAGREAVLQICEGRLPGYLAFGFRDGNGGPYEIAAAAFAQQPGPEAPENSLCAVSHYVQP